MKGEKSDEDATEPPKAKAANAEGHKEDNMTKDGDLAADNLESGESKEVGTKQHGPGKDTEDPGVPPTNSSAKRKGSEVILTSSTSRPGAFAINNPLSDNPIAEGLRGMPTATVELQTPSTADGTNGSSQRITTAEPISVTVADPIEDIGNDESSKQSNKSNKVAPNHQRRIQMLVAAAIAILVVLVIVLSIALSDAAGNTPSGNDPSTEDDIFSKRRADMIEFLGRSVDSTAFDPNHPNASEDRIEALRWIVEEDQMQLPIPASNTTIDDPASTKLLERYIATLLYIATNGEDWYEQFNFLSQFDVCRWTVSFADESDFNPDNVAQLNVKGLGCNKNGRVVTIRIWWNNLSGTVPEELGLLDLNQLVLTGGSLVGTFPSFVANFSKLENLSLSDNCLTGTIPEELGDISSLTVLAVYNNNYELTGNLEPFCESPTSYREGAVIIIGDYGVDCSCCVKCRPDEYECDDKIWNATWPTKNTDQDEAYDQRGNVAQFQANCLTPEQREWIDDECPCVVVDAERASDNTFGESTGNFWKCDDCTSDGSRPSIGN
eukprot:CAMPEP_0116135628 /NCGR_PEP_ID=MMETSP0329-20121206/11289_1 /TAXON_ID=697910 /ORGANISM="Pseudo-nitzschia arenysensis, Strain B593" /LENGTH=550 /DNA_ID=CAMNT_0003630435 /DNA_START=121 /DNA_END=1773 /DNA_ORIENTATION=-